MYFRNLRKEDWGNTLFPAARQRDEAIPWRYWPRERDDCIIICDVDLILDAGIELFQTASAAVLAEDGCMIPAECIVFAFCLHTGEVLYNKHWHGMGRPDQ